MATFQVQLLPVYVTPTEVRRLLGTQAQATNDDDILMFFCDNISRRIEQYCNRRFFIYRQSIKMDWRASYVLYAPEDLYNIVTLTNGDGNVIPATSGSTQVIYYYPSQEYPKYKIELSIISGVVFLYTGTPQQAITMDAWYGFPAIPNTGQYYISSGAVVAEAVTGQNATQTTLVVPTGTYHAGQTILIETEMEIVQAVTAMTPSSNYDTCTVLRGSIGTTAATHANGTTINTIVFHPDIVQAAYRLAAYAYRQKDSQMFDQIGIQQMGTLTLPMAIPQDVRAILNQYVRSSR